MHELLQAATEVSTALGTLVLAAVAVWGFVSGRRRPTPVGGLPAWPRQRLIQMASMMLLLDESVPMVSQLVEEVLDEWRTARHPRVLPSRRLELRLTERLRRQMDEDYRDAVSRGVAMSDLPRVTLWELRLDDAHMIARRLPRSSRWEFARNYWRCCARSRPPARRRPRYGPAESPAPGRRWVGEDS